MNLFLDLESELVRRWLRRLSRREEPAISEHVVVTLGET